MDQLKNAAARWDRLRQILRTSGPRGLLQKIVAKLRRTPLPPQEEPSPYVLIQGTDPGRAATLETSSVSLELRPGADNICAFEVLVRSSDEGGVFEAEVSAGSEIERTQSAAAPGVSWVRFTFSPIIIHRAEPVRLCVSAPEGSALLTSAGGRPFVRLYRSPDPQYEGWRMRNRPGKGELAAQRARSFEPGSPFFSIVVPLFNTPEPFLRALVDSVRAQTYGNWELCVADGSTDEKDRHGILASYQDTRIRYRKLETNEGISGNTNRALSMARGDYIVLADHDDLLAPHALYLNAAALKKEPQADLLYSDEDKVTENGRRFFEPFFKPDYSPDLLNGFNYITHLLVFRKDLLNETGLFRSHLDGAQDYDLTLRLLEKARVVVHLPDVLYHWRVSAASTASGAEAKSYTEEAAMQALRAAAERRGLPVSVEPAAQPNRFHLTYPLPVPAPGVSLVIPALRAKDALQAASRFAERTQYPDLEIICVCPDAPGGNGIRASKRLPLRFIPHSSMNPAELCNAGAQAATGQLLIFADASLVPGDPEWLAALASEALRQSVGAAGPLICGKDNRIVEAELVVGLEGIAGCAHRGAFRDAPGYLGRLAVTSDVSALSGLCLATRKELFSQTGGFDTGSEGLYFGIDYCLRIRNKGLGVVFTPRSVLKATRKSLPDILRRRSAPEKLEAAASQWRQKWSPLLPGSDPFFSPNLSLDGPSFAVPKYADGAKEFRKKLEEFMN